MQNVKRVVIICAHSDDQVMGAGGTIGMLAKDGVEIKTFICSFGEQSHPHLKPEELRKTRVIESKTADHILGGKGVMFLGMREGKFIEDYEKNRWHQKLLRHLRDFRPDVILTHSIDDPHPDHRAVYKIVLDVYKSLGNECEVYSFDIWNLFNIKKRRNPMLLVDITPMFTRKLDALSMFKSQKVALFALLWSVYAKAIYYGFKRGVRYAEVFYKVR